MNGSSFLFEFPVSPKAVITSVDNSDILLTEIAVSKGSNVSFACLASGIPRPDLEWSHTTTGDFSLSENFIEFDPAYALLNETESKLGVTMSVLTILGAQFPAHNGSYTCNGSNVNPKTMNLHYNSSSLYITVLGMWNNTVYNY